MTKQYYKNLKDKQQKIAKERIIFLFKEAKASFKKEPLVSNKNVKVARRIAMKYKIKMPSTLKKQFCKNCGNYIIPGINCRVRIHKHRLIYYCFGCKHYMRHPLK